MKNFRRDTKPLLLSDDPPLLSDDFGDDGDGRGDVQATSIIDHSSSRKSSSSWKKRILKGLQAGGGGTGGSGHKQRMLLRDDGVDNDDDDQTSHFAENDSGELRPAEGGSSPPRDGDDKTANGKARDVTPPASTKANQRKSLLFGRRRRKKKNPEDANSVSSSSQGSQSTGKTTSSASPMELPPHPPTSILRKKSDGTSPSAKSVSIDEQSSSQQVIDDLLRAEAVAASPLRSPARSKMTPPQQAVHQYLTRPFGRSHIDTKRYKWAVQVQPAEWEPDEKIWKYRVTVQQRTSSRHNHGGNTVRSLADFYWLERALQAEFHGALLLPNLSIALGVPTQQVHDQVDAELLTHWLSDVLNGVRGHGELFLAQRTVELITSESMEAFLYRTAEGALSVELIADIAGVALLEPNGRGASREEEEERGIWQFPFVELCGGGVTVTQETPPRPKQRLKLPLDMISCSSRALGGAQSFQVQDSFAEPGTYDVQLLPPVAGIAIHTELLAAEQDVAYNWRARALRVMERQHALAEREKHVGSAWKQFALAISDLFAYEKGMESARLGDSKSRRDMQMPYRKLQKSAVDDCLRAMAKHKQERYAPALEGMTGLLNAYVADLSAVQPSVDAYLRSAEQLAAQKQRLKAETSGGVSKSGSPRPMPNNNSLADHFKSGLDDLRKQISGATPTSDGDGQALDNSALASEKERKQLRHQLRSTEHRLLAHEALLRDSLTTVCKATPVRVARMAYKHYACEAMHCTMLRSAAVAMRTKISVVNKDSLAKMISRHLAEAKEDDVTELKLAQRIVNIGNSKKYSRDDSSTMSEEVEQGVEIDTGSTTNGDDGRSEFRDNALKLCNERIGRWNAQVATAIMKAVGVEVNNVRFEESTRDLRTVQKFAVGLRESLQRCIGALEVLKLSALQGDGNTAGKETIEDLSTMRRNFVEEMEKLFSATYIPLDSSELQKKSAEPSARILQSVGIHLVDESGWKQSSDTSCGGAVEKYMDARESSAQWLLDSLAVLLKEYNERVESVESFVFMDCVGIQLEKHFSQMRGTALAAFEKKTDITSAMNIATRKRMPRLVDELKAKMETIGTVSHTTVKQSKEAHLESKIAKSELHDLAVRRLTRVREASTERVVALMALWVKEEETSSNSELQALKDVVNRIIGSVGKDHAAPYLEYSSAVELS